MSKPPTSTTFIPFWIFGFGDKSWYSSEIPLLSKVSFLSLFFSCSLHTYIPDLDDGNMKPGKLHKTINNYGVPIDFPMDVDEPRMPMPRCLTEHVLWAFLPYAKN